MSASPVRDPNLAGESAPIPNRSSRPQIWSASASPMASEQEKPDPLQPLATHSPGTPGTGPARNSPSGLMVNSPPRCSATGALVASGTSASTCPASFRSTSRSSGTSSVLNEPGSSLGSTGSGDGSAQPGAKQQRVAQVRQDHLHREQPGIAEEQLPLHIRPYRSGRRHIVHDQPPAHPHQLHQARQPTRIAPPAIGEQQAERRIGPKHRPGIPGQHAHPGIPREQI